MDAPTRTGADLRAVAVDRLVTGQVARTAQVAEDWLRVRGYISTVPKHGGAVLVALHDALTGKHGNYGDQNLQSE